MENRINIIEKNLELKSICRRIHHRVEVSLPIRLETKTDSLNLPLNLTGYTTDISEGGLGVILKERLKVSSNLRLFIDSTIHYPTFQTEAITLWKDTDILVKDGVIRYGLRFSETKDRDLVRDFLNKVSLYLVENFFGFALPDHLREACKDNYVLEKFDQKQIMRVIDFVPPFLKIGKMIILGHDKNNILQNVGFAAGVLTTKDTQGHYNNAIHLAQCGQLMSSAASIYLALLFPSTAPQVVEVDQIRLSQVGVLLELPSPAENYFFIEIHIIKKKLQLVIVNTKIFFSKAIVCEIDRLKLILISKESIWKAKELPAKNEDFFKKTNTDEIERFFGVTSPEHIKKSYVNQQISKRLNQQEIMKIVDFTPPFLKIDKIMIFNADKNQIDQTFSLGMGIVTSGDTSGHYNETIFLAMCGWLMASAVSIHLAVLFPSTAPEVIEAKGIKPIEKEMWKPPANGAIFWVETRVIKKTGQLVMLKTKISFDEIPYGVAEESKAILLQK
ncbi:MAG: PilZ domain-containing protein [Candidatus Omnitrophota bacterium]|nr:PilZ domain-containing protein [Candidatus Omnitrophota bacterium]